jgi:hypothetical protein
VVFHCMTVDGLNMHPNPRVPSERNIELMSSALACPLMSPATISLFAMCICIYIYGCLLMYVCIVIDMNPISKDPINMI